MISQLVSPTNRIGQDKSFIVPGLHPSTYKVYAVISARVYHAAFGSKQHEWIYSGLNGSLMFGKERGAIDVQTFWFRLLDDAGKTIWIFKIPEISFVFTIDKPFFHVFRGSSRKFGFLYMDDNEAAGFAKKVIGRTMKPRQFENPLAAMAAELPRSIRSRLASSAMGRLSPTIISAPTANSFVHVAHVGAGKGEPAAETDEVEPSWTMVLAESHAGGLSPGTMLEQHDIAEEYMKGRPPPRAVGDDKPKLNPQKVRRKPSPVCFV
ncbi:hypothetical protein C8R43DRAFT_618791 [Mycena crocata]|nr:hypothetical protein C8R43DRAFT_618791 [Mycena crocata]